MTEPTTAIAKPLDPLRQILEWIIAGNNEQQIVEAAEATWPGRKAQPLIVKAMEQLAKAGEPDPLIVKGFAVEGTRTIYQRAMEAGDYPTALRALRQLVELAGK